MGFFKNFFTPFAGIARLFLHRFLKNMSKNVDFEVNSVAISPNCTFFEYLEQCVGTRVGLAAED